MGKVNVRNPPPPVNGQLKVFRRQICSDAIHNFLKTKALAAPRISVPQEQSRCQNSARGLRIILFGGMSDYKVKFEVFEGPLDLLLYLIKKEEVDIYDVNLTRLATQFIEYIEVMRLLDLDIAGEFLVMASTLMYIKSRELLPVDDQVVVEGEEEGEDPRWELIRQLVEYKKFKDAAAQLQVRELEQENIYPRLPGKLDFASDRPMLRPDVSIFDLLNAVNGILKRFARRDDPSDFFKDKL